MNTPSPDPRAEETRSRLIAAGIELFGHFGYEAVTTRQLADTAQVNQAAIPYHFGGKQGVYLAVADHLATLTGARLRQIAETARMRLAENPDQSAIGALLLETTLAVARMAFESDHRGIWLIFLTREQFHPSAAFERLYVDVSCPLHTVLGELIGTPADAPDTIRLAHAYLGQIVGFVFARAGLDRKLGRTGDWDSAEAATTIATIERFSRYVIAGMVASQPPADG